MIDIYPATLTCEGVSYMIIKGTTIVLGRQPNLVKEIKIGKYK